MNSHRLLGVLYLALSIAMIAWDILRAGRIAQLRKMPRSFQAITGIAGLLLVPALVVAYTATSLLYGRAIYLVAWLWPFTALLFVIQTIYAMTRRLVTPALGFPLLLYNVIIAVVAVTKFMISRGLPAPFFGLALNAAQASMLGTFFGPPALWNPIYLQVPIFAPSLPARWGVTRLARVAMAGAAIAMTALVVVEVPGAYAGINSYDIYANVLPQEHPEGDFRIGLKVFPDLRSGPPPVAIDNDLSLADTLAADAISVVINPEGARGIALDSLARSIDRSRSDSSILIVALGFPKKGAEEFKRSRDAYTTARLKDIDQIARRLKPDYLIPATDPMEEGFRLLGTQDPQYWIDYFTRAARLAHYIYPRIKVAVPMSSYGTRDSILYAWAARPGTPIDVVGFSLLAGFDGARSLDTDMRVARRWMQQYPRPKEHWVFAAGGYPLVHGEESQLRAVWGVLAWATAQAPIKGLVVYEGGDYNTARGIRASGGRLRPVFEALVRAEKGLRASPQ
ncbi:MAG TPA: hypothetical protein VJ840_13760 [Gemmatimonadaceae bacterium]|nr:hypothetical protein [Gemmatimonadaceae bacterium]